MTRHLRALSRLAALVAWTAALYPAVLLSLPLTRASRRAFTRCHVALLRLWARGVARLIGMRIRIEGAAPRPPFLLVSNHLSYVDVIALQASSSCLFLAKTEIARWPVIGLLARTAGTVFVDRARRADLLRTFAAVEASVARGRGVAIFPEGTSTDGSAVLPFKPSLFEVAVRTGLPVYCASLGYRVPAGSPPARLSVCWWGDMEFFRHLYALLQIPSFEARIAYAGAPIARDNRSDRKDLAAAARIAVEKGFVPVVH